MYAIERVLNHNIKRYWLKQKQAKQRAADPVAAIDRLEKTCDAHPDTATKLHLASLYSQAELLDPSDTLYREVLALEPGNVHALNGLGWNRLIDDYHLSAAEYFQHALDHDNENRFALIHLGWAYFLGLQHPKLRELTGTLIETMPDEPEIYNYLTWSLQWFAMGSTNDPAKPYRNKVLQYCEHALKLDERNFCIHENLAFFYENSEDYKKALIHVQRLVELVPEVTDSWYALANIQMRLHQTDSAIATFNHILERSPDEMDALDCLSFLYAVTHDPESGAAVMQRVRTQDITNDSTYCWYFYDQLITDKKSTIQCLEKIIGLIPESIYALEVLGRFYKKNKMLHQAGQVYKKITETDPEYQAGWMELCRVQAETGSIYTAIETANKSCDNDNWHPRVLVEMGDILTDKGMACEAIPIFTRLLDFCSEDNIKTKADLYCKIGKAQVTQGNIDDAEMNLKKAVKIDDTNVKAHELLGNIYFEQKKLLLARRCYMNVVEQKDHQKELWQRLARINESLGYMREARECKARADKA